MRASALFVLLAAACSRELPAEHSAPGGAVRPTLTQPPVAPGIAVVELFTSEGCSSCPPADRALARVAERAQHDSSAVYALSFHVDYWNYLGWRDRFSDPRYSLRQRGYAAISAGGGTYTPQAVVNGGAECVGSNASRLDDLIDSALKRAPRHRIELTARREPASLTVDYRVSGDTAAHVLNLALIEPHADSSVRAGENSGEHLEHVNVVRAFASRALSDAGSGRLELPIANELRGRALAIVAYAQDAAQTDISGASALAVP